MSETFKIIFRILFSLFLTGYGSYVCYAAVKNKKRFIDSYKRFDMIKIFGDFGRVIYAILGIVIVLTGLYLTYTILHTTFK